MAKGRSPVLSGNASNPAQFKLKLPFRWLWLCLCGVLVVSLVAILAWRPGRYTSFEDLVSNMGENAGACQRTDAREFAEAFADFAAVPVSLGNMLEIGCSTTGVADALLSLQRRDLENVTVGLMPCDGECPRARPGQIHTDDNFFGSSSLYNIDSVNFEQLAHSTGTFNTVAGLYILDRADNPYRMLWTIYQALAPGGTLILYDRVYTGEVDLLDRVRISASLTAPRTASAVTPSILEWYLRQFQVLFRHDMHEYPDANGHMYRDMAVVARKPRLPTSGVNQVTKGGKRVQLEVAESLRSSTVHSVATSTATTSSLDATAASQAAVETAEPTVEATPRRQRNRWAREETAPAPKESPAVDQVAEPLFIEGVHPSTRLARNRYFLIWTTGKDTFDKLRYTVLDRLFATVPSAEVFVYANLLPDDMFAAYTARNLSITLVRYDEVHIFDGTPLARWAASMDLWRQGKFIYSHFTDAFRLCVLWKYGGTYIDFDVLVLRDLGDLRNSFGVEDEYGVTPLQPFWTRMFPQRLSMNFAIAVFSQGAPFLNYLMLQFHKVYDPTVWETVGPDLVTQGMRDWRNFHPSMVLERKNAAQELDDAAHTSDIEGAITVWTDAAAFYPVGWKCAVQSTSRASFNAQAMQAIRDRAFTFHVYTQMFKFEGIPFGYEKGSLLDHVVVEKFPPRQQRS